MSKEQQLAELERLLAAIRGEAVEDAASPRPVVVSPAAYEPVAGAQYLPAAPVPPVVPSVPAAQVMWAQSPTPVIDQMGRVVGWQQPQPPVVAPQSEPKFDVTTQRMVGGGVLLLGGGAGGAMLLHAAAAAVVPLGLIALIVVSLAYLKHSGKSGGGSANVNVSVNVRTNQRNG